MRRLLPVVAPERLPGSLCIACTVATEVFRADEAKDQAAVCSLHARAVPTMSPARKASIPEGCAARVTWRCVRWPRGSACRTPRIDCISRLATGRGAYPSDRNAIRAGYAEASYRPAKAQAAPSPPQKIAVTTTACISASDSSQSCDPVSFSLSVPPVMSYLSVCRRLPDQETPLRNARPARHGRQATRR